MSTTLMRELACLLRSMRQNRALEQLISQFCAINLSDYETVIDSGIRIECLHRKKWLRYSRLGFQAFFSAITA
jgi:hypothetical protein